MAGRLIGLGLFLSLLLMGQIAFAEQVIYQQDFEGIANGTGAGEIGFKVNATPEQSQWTVVNGYLKGLFHNKPHKGGSISVNIPQVRHGRLDFKAWIGNKNNRDFSLQVRLYRIFTSYKGFGSYRISWNRYTPRFINGEKAGWVRLKSRIPPDQWHHYRIEFNAGKNIILYYVDDMENPVYIDTRVPIFSQKEPQEGYTLRFGNYGMCSGDVEIRIDDIKLVKIEASGAEARVRRRNIIVVNGIDYKAYMVNQSLRGYDAGKVLYFKMVVGQNLYPRVRTRLEKIITDRQLRKARLFIMVNAPAVSLESFTREWLLENTKDGLRVLILGGLFSFGKGQYEGTTFEEICPVRIKSKWSVKKFKVPQPLMPTGKVKFSDKINWQAKPSVLYYHDVKLKAGDEVWLKAGKAPILVVRKLGDGYTAAFLTAPIGKPSGGTLAYWQWNDWPKLLGEITQKLMEKKN